MRISDWSSDVCSSDLVVRRVHAFCYLAELDPGFVSRLFDGHHAEPTKRHSTLSPLGVAILKHERLGPGAFDLASEAAKFSLPPEDQAAGHRLRVTADTLGQTLRVRHFQILYTGRVVKIVA